MKNGTEASILVTGVLTAMEVSSVWAFPADGAIYVIYVIYVIMVFM